MENQEGGKEGCCAKGKCCGAKALVAVALLGIGGIGGYFCGRQCALKNAPPAATQGR